MTFDEYQAFARTTAVYEDEYRLLYPSLGLAEEAGEVAGQVKRMLRDDDGMLTSERREKLLAEIGDCLWYCASLCSDLGVAMEEVAQTNRAKLQDRKERKKLKGQGDSR